MTDEGVEPGPPSPPGSVPCVSSIPSESCVIVPGQVPCLVHPLPLQGRWGGLHVSLLGVGVSMGRVRFTPRGSGLGPRSGCRAALPQGPSAVGVCTPVAAGVGARGQCSRPGSSRGLGLFFGGSTEGPAPHHAPRGVCWCGLPLVTLLGRVCTCRPGAVAARMGVARGDGHTHTTAGGQGQGRLPLSP